MKAFLLRAVRWLREATPRVIAAWLVLAVLAALWSFWRGSDSPRMLSRELASESSSAGMIVTPSPRSEQATAGPREIGTVGRGGGSSTQSAPTESAEVGSSTELQTEAERAERVAEIVRLEQVLRQQNQEIADVPSGAPRAPERTPASLPRPTPTLDPDPLPPPPAPAPLPVDAVLDQLSVGNMVFNRPASMVRGEAKRVTLLISQSSTIDELKAELADSADAIREQQIRIAPLMQARLTGSAFAISPITPEEQPMSATETTQWEWEIKPAEFGQLPLHLSVDMVVTIDGQERRRHLRSFEETIVVDVAWGPWIAAFVWENVEWLVTAILIPLGLWLFKRWRKRRRAPKDPPAPARPPARRQRGRRLAGKLWKSRGPR